MDCNTGEPGYLGAEAIKNGWHACRAAVLALFPDICPHHLLNLAHEHEYDHEQIITLILDNQENGDPYPTKPREGLLKRKRNAKNDSDISSIAISNNNDLADVRNGKTENEKVNCLDGKNDAFIKTYCRATKALLKNAFPDRYAGDIDRIMKQNKNLLNPSYFSLETGKTAENTPLRTKRVKRRPRSDDMFEHSQVEAEQTAAADYKIVKTIVGARGKKTAQQSEAEDMADCGCCFEKFAHNRMVHCDGRICHWFCLECAKRNAETQIGLSRYELRCISMDGCDGRFSKQQKDKFLNGKLEMALDRIEQESVLRLAGIKGLARCPFCRYAAEYPPVDQHPLFQCENPACRVLSCRLCHQENHIPKTCEEVAQDKANNARHRIEEAMSEALIRKCNNCGTPFIKAEGCNKMVCTAPNCYNIQCYVCSKSCNGYDHFDDLNRGGKKGNCPLFDNQEERHYREVRAAEKRARRLVKEENPGWLDNDIPPRPIAVIDLTGDEIPDPGA